MIEVTGLLSLNLCCNFASLYFVLNCLLRCVTTLRTHSALQIPSSRAQSELTRLFLPLQKSFDSSTNIPHIQQEGIMTPRLIQLIINDFPIPILLQTFRQFPLLFNREERVGLDSNDKCRTGEICET